MWKKTQDPQHLHPLLKMYEPVINYGMKQYKAPSIPEPAMRAELVKHVVNAFNSYDPAKGTALNTHVQNLLRKASRYNTKYQNVGYIPEGQKSFITPIQTARNELLERFGRDATDDEISQYTGLPTKMVKRVVKSLRKDVSASTFESDPTAINANADEEILSLLPHSLNEMENKVFSHLYGDQKGQHKGTKGALAKQLGMNPSQFSRLHSSIIKKYESYKK